jgi:hypothetical protein
MPSVLAIVSKAVFERDAKIGGKLAGVGEVVPMDRYVSKNKGLAPAGEGGALFLVTVRPPDEALWLVAILEKPAFDGENWVAAKNTAPIADVTGLKDKIKFANGSGISAKKGALGMSLQTPRVLADEDVALLRAAAGAPPGSAAAAASAKGHLNAHEEGGKTPCLCRRCIAQAPEEITVEGLRMLRDRAEAKGRFLWYWYPAALEDERAEVRRAVESRLHSRVVNAQKRRYDDLDATLGSGEEYDA